MGNQKTNQNRNTCKDILQRKVKKKDGQKNKKNGQCEENIPHHRIVQNQRQLKKKQYKIYERTKQQRQRKSQVVNINNHNHSNQHQHLYPSHIKATHKFISPEELIDYYKLGDNMWK